MDRQTEFEAALGSAVYEYSQLMFILRLAFTRLVDPKDAQVGRLLAVGWSKARIRDSWCDLTRHRFSARGDEASALKGRIKKVMDDRHDKIHGMYIGMGDHDPDRESGLRSFRQGRINWKDPKLRPEEVSLEDFRSFAASCRKLRGDFLKQFGDQVIES